MKLDVIKGAINSLKTYECINRIENLKKNNPDEKIIFIVPEQFSYSAEKLMTSHFGGTGLNNIEVLTMSRLQDRFLNRARRNYLTAAGKAVLIQKAINDVNKEENIYGGCIDKPGFVNTVADIITELKRCLITPSILSECANNAKNTMLKRKLLSVADIYSRYQELNSDKFYDAEEDLTRLSYVIANDMVLADAYVFIDEFSEFYPQHYRVIESVLKTAKGLTITLPIDEDNKELSQIPTDTLNRLKKLAQKNGAQLRESTVLKSDKFFKSDEINFYFNNYDKFNDRRFMAFKKETKDITLFTAKDPYSEVENVAKNIRWLVDEKDYRYRDIAVCCGNCDDYIGIIQAVFKEYNIKYFTDVKLSITDHPVVLTIISLFDIIKENWSYDSVFRYLKSGFIYKKVDDEISQFSADDIDLLDYYVLKYGIKGKKKWLDDEEWELKSASISDALSDYQNRKDSEITVKINKIRQEIVAPIKRFIDKTSRRNSVKNIAKALFEFLEEIHLCEGLKKEVKSLSQNNMINEAEQLSQVWNLLIAVLDQTVTALGDTKCSREDFKKFIYSGLSVNEISIIPPALDGVLISAANAVKNNSVKALFIIGAIRGKIPCEKTDEGMFSDSDRKELDLLLAQNDCEIRANSAYYRTSEEYKLFRVIFSARELLKISYPLNNFNGEAQMPSQMILDLRKIFSSLTQINDLTDEKRDLDRFFTVNSAFDYLLKNRNKKNDMVAKQIYRWFLDNDELKDKLLVIKNADLYKVEKAKILPKNAELLYSDMLNYSASRLKVYADCPFKYFMQYGLGAKPEQIWQIQKFDLGTLMHYIICKYCEIIEADADDFEALRKKWNDLTAEESDKIIDSIISQVTSSIISSVGKDEEKIKYLLMRIKKIIQRSCEIVRISLTKGEYTAVEYEKEFLIKLDSGERSVGIKGTIDRIDIAQNEESAGIRVIDYKSGKKDFSVVSVCNMQDVQLILYATAALELFKMGNIKYSDPSVKSRITGIMYNKLRDTFVEAKGASKSEIADMLSKEMRLNGVVILDTTIDAKENEHFDLSDAFLMDSDIEATGESSYLKIALKKDGEPKQNSEIISRAGFNKLTEYVKKQIIKTDLEIMSGNIEILPYSEADNSACDYCEMSEVCLFDKNRDGIRSLCKNADEAWEKIEAELKK